MSAVPVPPPRISEEPILVATGITKKFGGLAAVDGVDLTIRRGEILGVIGPNGAGKTTFVNCMTGLDKPTAGAILFNDRDITKTPSFRIGHLGMARTFQVVKPLRQLTVRENVATGAMFGARGRQRTAAQARAYADEVLERVALADKRDRTATELTIPDLKRLELAKALAMDPTLLFLDEVMAGLNQSEIEKAMELILTINRSGVTIFVIEHVMKAIMGISDRLVVLHFGRKIAEGDPKAIVESPEVIEAYLGERFAQRARGAGEPSTAFVASGEFRKAAPVATGSALLDVKGLSSGYGEVQILRNVSLTVREKEIVALIGANGAGKTTLLNTISQLLRPMAGSISFAGGDITAVRPDEIVGAGIVHVPQGRRLFAGLTVKENLQQGAYLRKRLLRDRRGPQVGVRAPPPPEGALRPDGRAPVRRRAADVRDRAGPHGPPAPPPHRRAVPWSRPARRRPPPRPHLADQREGDDRPPRRAGRSGRPRACPPGIRPRDRPDRPGRAGGGTPRRPAHPAGVPRVVRRP